MVKEKAIPLTAMKMGQAGRIVFIDGGAGMRARLEALGIRPGVRIVKKTAVMRCGPVVVSAGTGEVAMGYGMAARIFVEVEE